MSSNRSYSISQYNRSVERLIVEKIPAIWVHGVITQLVVREKITYLTLGEFFARFHHPPGGFVHGALDFRFRGVAPKIFSTPQTLSTGG